LRMQRSRRFETNTWHEQAACSEVKNMNEVLWKSLREVLQECYGVDIDDAVFRFSTQNYAFIFPDKPYMIRVSMSPTKSRREIMSELIWVDDLKQFKQTICEPSVSQKGNLMEEFVIGETTYRASMFRTARGAVQATTKMTPMYFICVGELLGAIHRVSTDEREMGMKFSRPVKADQFRGYIDRTFPGLSPELQQKILDIEARVNALPDALGHYGLCHGDFHGNNFFVEANNIWLFDFDGCAYANYMYDVASFVMDCLFKGYGAGRDARELIEKEIMPYFKLGYELNKADGQTDWDQLELMMYYRAALGLMAMEEIKECGVMDIERARQYFRILLMHEDIFAALTRS